MSVKDIAAGSDSSSPSSLVSFKGQLFFTAYDGDGGRELWKSDGTSAGTLRVKDIATSSSSADPINLTVVGNTLCFAAYGESRRELSC